MAATETERTRLRPAGKNGAESSAVSGPAVTTHESARALATPEVREALDGVLAVVFDRAQQEGADLEKVEVYGKPAYDEIGEQLVVSISVPLPMAGAFAFWGNSATPSKNGRPRCRKRKPTYSRN